MSQEHMSWSPDTYLQFEAERSRPARDLVAAIPDARPVNAIDLGCGPGNSTEILKIRFPDTTIEGIDSSADMIDAARTRLPRCQFTQADITTWNPAKPYGIIFANAALQWLPDHETLLPRLIKSLSPNGTLAIQMPDNLDEPAHRLMRNTAQTGPWAKKCAHAAAARQNLKTADWYYRLLKPHAARIDIWRTTYLHALPGGPAALVDWFRGTGLRPFLDPLTAAEQEAFLAAYTAGLAPLYPADEDGIVLLPFPRLFLIATT